MSALADLVQEIAAASREQSSGIEQINSAINQVSQTTQANASTSHHLSSTAASMSTHAGQLQTMMQFFRVPASNDTRANLKHAPPAHAHNAHAPGPKTADGHGADSFHQF